MTGMEIDQIIGENNHCIGVLGGGRGKGDVEFLGRGRLNYRQSHAEIPGCAGYLLGYDPPVYWVARIDQERNFRGARNQFPEDFYSFCGEISGHEGRKTCDVAAWAREALDEAEGHGIGHCACRKLDAEILVVQSAENWTTKNVSGAIDGARDRCILLQG